MPSVQRDSAAIDQRMRDRAQVDIFEFAADRHPAREPRHSKSTRLQGLADRMRGGFALGSEVGGNDDLLDTAFDGTVQQRLQAGDLRRLLGRLLMASHNLPALSPTTS